MNIVVCKCGRKMAFAAVIGEDGEPEKNGDGSVKKVPLDLTAPVYLVLDGVTGEDGKCVPTEVAASGRRIETGMPTMESIAYVSHFSTCPNAAEFSRGRKNIG